MIQSRHHQDCFICVENDNNSLILLQHLLVYSAMQGTPVLKLSDYVHAQVCGFLAEFIKGGKVQKFS